MTAVVIPKARDTQTKQTAQDTERELVAHLCKTVKDAGIASDPIDITNFYVALKSKPLMVVAGPAGSGKVSLLEGLSSILTGSNSCDNYPGPQSQILLGHPWWTETSENMALFTVAHIRFNTDRLLFNLSEALRSENSQRLYITCLSHTSPAELMDFFSKVSVQKIHTLLANYRQPLLVIAQVENLLVRQRIFIPRSIFDDTLAYLANSWSNEGNGLFFHSTIQNLAMATDLAISQILLPRAAKDISPFKGLLEDLSELFASRYPRSASLVSSLTGSSAGKIPQQE